MAVFITKTTDGVEEIASKADTLSDTWEAAWALWEKTHVFTSWDGTSEGPEIKVRYSRNGE